MKTKKEFADMSFAELKSLGESLNKIRGKSGMQAEITIELIKRLTKSEFDESTSQNNPL